MKQQQIDLTLLAMAAYEAMKKERIRNETEKKTTTEK